MDITAANILAHQLLSEHGLLDKGWRFEFDRARTRFGVCRFNDRVIGLSAPLVQHNSADEVRDTVLHEIAHAMVGPDAGHDWRWKAACRRIGARPERCSTNVNFLRGKHTIRCRHCSYTWTVFRLGKRLREGVQPDCTTVYHSPCGELGKLELVMN